MFAQTAIGAIGIYQRYVSPYKGFRCAHRVRTGRLSCSAFATRAIARVGMLQGMAILRRRFVLCRESSEILIAENSDPKRAPGFSTSGCLVENGGSCCCELGLACHWS